MAYQLRKCAMCGSTYEPTGSSQKVCKTCSSEYRRQQNIEHLRKLREAEGAVPTGTMLLCSDCGDDFVYKSGPQHRCHDCQNTHKVKRIHEWLASDQERLKKYTTKAKDNYNFSGNRAVAMERDKHTCQHCGCQNDLHVHHIDGNGVTTPKESRNNALDNLITLCRGCHTKEHHRIRHSS